MVSANRIGSESREREEGEVVDRMVDRTADVADNGPSADLVGGEDVARLVEETGRVVELARGLQDSMASLLSRTSIDDQDLRQRALALDSDLRKLQASIDSRSSTIDSKVTDKVISIHNTITILYFFYFYFEFYKFPIFSWFFSFCRNKFS